MKECFQKMIMNDQNSVQPSHIYNLRLENKISLKYLKMYSNFVLNFSF
jgi:hypothetical protein